MILPHTARERAPVLAFHCSGADGQQWQRLAQSLQTDFDVSGLDLYGTRATGHWPGHAAFTLDEEAKPVLASIDRLKRSVHLVGHSYGGAVALHVAMQRPTQVASLTLYEPSAFHILKQLGLRGWAARNEIAGIARLISAGVTTGDRRSAAEAFIDYWNGPGAWARMKREVQAAMLEWLPKGPLDFQAALGDGTPLGAYRRITCPVMIVRGEHARPPSRLIAERLAASIPTATLRVLANAGHMGPLTHATEVNALLGAHITEAELSCGINAAA